MTIQIDTYLGYKVDLQGPLGAPIEIRDIARSLSRICRFAGHSSEFYSVAQHATLVVRIIDAMGRPDLHGCALHHDSHEAYLGDISSPLKRLLRTEGEISTLDRTARQFDQVIRESFGIPEPTAEDVAAIKEADVIALSIESRRLMHPDFVDPRAGDISPISEVLELGPILTPDDAYLSFLRMHAELVPGAVRS